MKYDKGRIEFFSDNVLLERGFYWAKAMALSYVREGDPVGDWYEAALPGRDSFCMRDTSHQSVGAQVLGLDSHNKNMLYRFAQNIAASRHYCSYWEIHRDNVPTPVDYTNDNDFWYNLPANFDILFTCWKMLMWTNDSDYKDDLVFKNFYDLTVNEYVRYWDKNNDGIPEQINAGSRLGIPSYDEGIGRDRSFMMSDLIAIQAAAYSAYASIKQLCGEESIAHEFLSKAKQLREYHNRQWWDDKEQRFFTVMTKEGTLTYSRFIDAVVIPLYYGLITEEDRLVKQIEHLLTLESHVESMSYIPETLYKYGVNDKALKYLLKLTDPNLKRREYPEVSYSVIGTFACGLMGIEPFAPENLIMTASHLSDGVSWARISDVPVFNGSITVEHKGIAFSTIINNTGKTIRWKARFPGYTDTIVVNGKEIKAEREDGPNGQKFSSVTVSVCNNKTSEAYMQCR